MFLAHNLALTFNSITAFMRYWASINNVALKTLKIVYPPLLDVGCHMSHTLNLVGEHFKLPNLLDFLNSWLLHMLFSHSTKTKFLWRELTGKSMATYSHTKWWSKWEVMHQLLQYFGDVEPFLF